MAGQFEESDVPEEANPQASEPGPHETLLATVDPEIVKAVVKPLLGMGALVFLLIIVSFLPGLSQVIPATPITFAALIIALFSIGIVSVLLYTAPHIETLVQQKLGASNALTANAAGILKHLNFLVAVFVAHWGLSGALLPFLSDTEYVWSYDIAFLALALIPTVNITRHLYRGLDPTAELLTRKITRTTDWDNGMGSAIDADPESGISIDSPSESGDGSTGKPSSDSVPMLHRLGATELKEMLSESIRGGESQPPSDVLTKQERVLQILDEQNGRIQQSGIVELTGWSKSTVSRVLSEMNENGSIVKTNIGQGNLITLPGAEPEGTRPRKRERED